MIIPTKIYEIFFGFDIIMVISERIQKEFESQVRNENERNRIARIFNPLDTTEVLPKLNCCKTNTIFSKLFRYLEMVGNRQI